MAHRPTSIALIFWLAAAPLVMAQQAEPQTSVAATGTVQAEQGVIAGSVLDQDRKPLPDARVRLRNLRTSQIEQNSTTDRKGEFRFVAEPETPYVVELSDPSGRILTLSEVITLHKGEVSATVLIAGAELPAFAHFFGNAAGLLAVALSGLGVTTLQDAPPLSPEK